MNETTMNSQKARHAERRVESHWEEHPMTLPCICAKEPLPSTKAFQWGSGQGYTAEDKCIEHRNCPINLSLPLHGATSYYPSQGQNRSSDGATDPPSDNVLLLFHLRKSCSGMSRPTGGMTEWSCSWVWKAEWRQRLDFRQANRHIVLSYRYCSRFHPETQDHFP